MALAAAPEGAYLVVATMGGSQTDITNWLLRLETAWGTDRYDALLADPPPPRRVELTERVPVQATISSGESLGSLTISFAMYDGDEVILRCIESGTGQIELRREDDDALIWVHKDRWTLFDGDILSMDGPALGVSC